MKWYPWAGACLLLMGLASAARGEAYKLVDLGTLGGNASRAFGINDAGQVVGSALNSANRSRAFLWSNGTMTDLGTLGGNASHAYGINDLGQVVGSAHDSSGKTRPFLWSNGAMTDLGTFDGPSGSATAINNAGQIVGNASISDDERRAVLWSDGQIKDLGTLGGPWRYANGINESGQVVGEARLDKQSGYLPRAFLWEEATGMADLGTLPGRDSAIAHGINSTGQVVGGRHLWDHGTITDLGVVGGHPVNARAINDVGQVVGQVRVIDEQGEFLEWRAFLWSNGASTDLNDLIDPDLGWHLCWARDINNRGYIVGFGIVDGEERAFLLVPEPTSIAMFLSGAVLGALCWWRKRRHALRA